VAPYITAFYEMVEARPNNILLSYLVLPLVLYPASRDKLKSSNIKSTIQSFLSQPNVQFGLGERVQEYKEITNQSLIALLQNSSLTVDDDLQVHLSNMKPDKSACSSISTNSAKNLGKILNKYDVISCYRALGVKEL